MTNQRPPRGFRQFEIQPLTGEPKGLVNGQGKGADVTAHADRGDLTSGGTAVRPSVKPDLDTAVDALIEACWQWKQASRYRMR